MSSLDVYCLSHFEDKQFYAAMVEIGLTLDCNDFLPNGYLVDEEKYLKSAAKLAGRKRKGAASSSQQETEVVEEEEDNGSEEDNRLDVSDDEIGPPGGSEPPLSGAHLTLPDADREVLCRRTVMTPQTLFGDNAMDERAGLPHPGPTMETRQAKRAKQGGPLPGAEASSLVAVDDIVSAKLLALEERVQRMTESNFTMQASLQQSLADQARKSHKMMMLHQREMVDSQREFMKITGDSMKDMFGNLPTMVMSIVQKVQTMNPTPLSCVDPQLLLTMENPLLAPSSSQAPLPLPMAPPPHSAASPPLPESHQRSPPSSVPLSIQSPQPVVEPEISSHKESEDVALPSG